MAHLIPVKTPSGSMSGSPSLQDQTGLAVSDGVGMVSPKPEMPRQNSDPSSDTPGPAQNISSREERDRDRTAWLREQDIPPRIPQRTTSISPALVRKNSPNGVVGLGPRTGSQLIRARPGVQSSSESYGGLAEDPLGDAYNSSRDSTLMMRESNSPNSTPTTALQELSDMAEVRLNHDGSMFANELLRQEQARLNEARKISVVNVNPTNIRPHSDTPEIRKYKKRFNSEILCAALWGRKEHCLFSVTH
ncbi:hypothetical protein GOODEAATRI_013621 [Goodea atripinnis]|uniref:Uncharacterized protein n=1 Tax=Goodea atripinnis TaxID=208336 RepID=A0ABV0MRT4_9TELE